jgi:Spy/CpxP family protein refolding chaperone
MHPMASQAENVLRSWLHARRGAACGEGASFGSHGGGPWHGGHHGPSFGGGGGADDLGGGSFGVRRPLRFLAYKLELDQDQITELASILADLKTERAQAAVDERRSTAALADVVAAEAFDEVKAKATTGDRVKSAERVEDAVAKSLGRIHKLLKPEQRAKLAYLLRTGALSI